MLKVLEYVKNKTIYMTPYNDSARVLKNLLDDSVSYNFMGYIDMHAVGDDIYKNTREGVYDYILIVSENYYLNIYENLVTMNIDKSKILNVSVSSLNQFSLNQITIKKTIKKKIIFFGNCQARQLSKIYSKHLDYDKYSITYYANYGRELDKISTLEAIKKTDILIYQPLSKKHNEFSEVNIKRVVHPNAILISFPYIYNNGLYSLEYNGINVVSGEDEILNLYKSGLNLDKVIALYRQHQIDFHLEEKFFNSLRILKDKESSTDIKIANFIENNYQRKKLFTSAAHPTNVIFYEIVKQLNKLLELHDIFTKNLKVPNLQATLVPISPYDIIAHNYKFNCSLSDNQWDIIGVAIIEIIINNYRLRKYKFSC